MLFINFVHHAWALRKKRTTVRAARFVLSRCIKVRLRSVHYLRNGDADAESTYHHTRGIHAAANQPHATRWTKGPSIYGSANAEWHVIARERGMTCHRAQIPTKQPHATSCDDSSSFLPQRSSQNSFVFYNFMRWTLHTCRDVEKIVSRRNSRSANAYRLHSPRFARTAWSLCIPKI